MPEVNIRAKVVENTRKVRNRATKAAMMKPLSAKARARTMVAKVSRVEVMMISMAQDFLCGKDQRERMMKAEANIRMMTVISTR